MTKLEKPLVVNLFAGPGTGKSTVAAQIFAHLKWQGFSCELVTEFAKERFGKNLSKCLTIKFTSSVNKYIKCVDL